MLVCTLPSLVVWLQLLPYTAACPASYPYQCLTRVVLGDGHLFAALWEGKGGSQAARHCVSVCYDLVVEGVKSGADPSVAMQKACQQLDESYFASDLPDLVRTVAVLTALWWSVGHVFPNFEQQSSASKLLVSLRNATHQSSSPQRVRDAQWPTSRNQCTLITLPAMPT